MLNHKLTLRALFAFTLLLCIEHHSVAQTKHTILIPSEGFKFDKKLSAVHEPSKSAISAYNIAIQELKNYLDRECRAKLNPKIDSLFRKEMKTITEGTPYVLVVDFDYKECEIVAFRPDKGTGSIIKPGQTIFHIMLQPEIKLEPIIKPDDPSTYESSLLSTYINDEGKWVAIGPYLESDGYATEERAIGSLFFGTNDYKYVSKKGRYKIYTLNKLPHKSMIDVRFFLKQAGITDLPK